MDSSKVMGLLNQDQKELIYFSEVTQNTTTSKGSLQIFINSNSKNLQRGCPYSFYQEVRIWSIFKSQSEIAALRFQQLDVPASLNLVSYFKLMKAPYEKDYVNGANITLIGSEWQPDNELLVCPLGMFAPQKSDLNCYRDTNLEVKLYAYRNGSNYSVTSYFSSFRNNHLRDRPTIFNYSWNIENIQGPLNLNHTGFKTSFLKQSKNQALQLNEVIYNQSVKYNLRMTLSDPQNLQDSKTGIIALIPMECANIFDRQTRESFVYRDLEIQKGSTDYTLMYEYSDCSDYKLDPNLMTFTLDGLGELSQADHNFKNKSFTIRSTSLGSMPINEYFYLRVQAYWKNVKNSYDQVSFNLFYALRFTQKLVVNLSTPNKVLLKGQTLSISAKVDLFNTQQSTNLRTYQGRWVCPGDLNRLCSLITSPTLRLVYDQVLDYNYTFWNPQTFTYQVFPNYLQIDQSRQSNNSLQVEWLDVKQDVSIKVINQVNRQQPFTWQLDSELDRLDLFQMYWDLTPALATPQSCLLNQANRTQYSVASSCLKEQSTYQLSLRLIYLPSLTVLANEKLSFTVPRSPWGGTLQCNVTSAKAYIDTVRCAAQGWLTGDGGSPRYQFMISNANGTRDLIGPPSNTSNFERVLPPTNQVSVRVIDKYQQETIATFNIKVIYQDITPPTPTPPPIPPPPVTPPSPPTPPTTPPVVTPPTPPPPIPTPPTPPTPVPPIVTPPSPPPTTPPSPPVVTPPPQPSVPPTPPTPPSPPVSPPTPPVSPPTPPVTPPVTPPTPTPTPTTPPTSPPKPPTPPPPSPSPLDPNDQPVKSMQDYILSSSSLAHQSASGHASEKSLQDTAALLTAQIAATDLTLLTQPEDKKFFVAGAIQVYRDISSSTTNINATIISSMVKGVERVMQERETIGELYGVEEFQKNVVNMQSNVIASMHNIEGVKDAGVIIRNNIQAYETIISTKLIDGQTFSQSSGQLKIDIKKISKGANQTDQTIISKDLNATFPLSTAAQPTGRQSLTMITFGSPPFYAQDMINQTLLTNNTVFFAYRNANGTYLDNSYILDYIQMNFTIPQNTTAKNIQCVYASPDDLYWKNSSCKTDVLGTVVQCRCKHMSYYTIIDNLFNEEAYYQRNTVTIYTLKIRNWVFFIPVAYLILLFIWGIIYTANKDQVDFRLIHDYEQLAVPQNNDATTISLNSLLFYRKIGFQSHLKKPGFCQLFEHYLMLLHPLFSLKYKLDPTLPRIYSFLILFTRLMLIFGLSFYFLRHKLPLTYTDLKLMSLGDIYYQLIALAVLSLILLPLPSFLFSCCRSHYLLLELDKSLTTDSAHSNEEQKKLQERHVTKVEIDPNLPLRLLFIINSSAHEQIVSGIEWASGNVGAVGRKMEELEKEGPVEVPRIIGGTPEKGVGHIMPQLLDDSSNGKQYIIDQLTEMDMVKANDNSDRMVIEEEKGIQNSPNSPNKLQKMHRSNSPSTKRVDSPSRPKSSLNQDDLAHQSQVLLKKAFATSASRHPSDPSLIDSNQAHYRTIDNKQQQYYEKGSTFNQKHQSQRSQVSNRMVVLETEEENFKYEGGEGSAQKEDGPPHSTPIGSDISNQFQQMNFDDEIHESGISIDTNMVAADDKKEIQERRGVCGVISRVILVLLVIAINGFVILVVGYTYYNDKYYNNENEYGWIVVFFLAQMIGFFIFDILMLLFVAICVSCCCKRCKVCLGRCTREALYVYEDFKYVADFSRVEEDFIPNNL